MLDLVQKTDKLKMVSSNAENGVEAPATKLPPGKYRVVSFDMDRTGRRLIDEICQIAAYTPYSQFTQYVMPFKDLNVGSRYRHSLRVATVGKYRMLKCAKTGVILKTKSEISALTDFVQWLENLKAEGIILVSHDSMKTTPPYLIDVLQKYNLYDRFAAVVKGFANSYFFADKDSLSNLAKVLFDKSEEMHSAARRARLAYEIVQHMCSGKDDMGSGDATSTPEMDNPAMSEAMRLIATSVADEVNELEKLKKLVDRQNGLRKIFGDKINSRLLAERHRANDLRRLLAEADLTYENLLDAWAKDKKEGLVKLMQERFTKTEPEDFEDLTDILLSHFDPEHYPQVSLCRDRRNAANANAQSGGGAGDGGKGDDKKEQKTQEKQAQQPAGDKSNNVTSTTATATPTASPVAAAATRTTTGTTTAAATSASGKASPGKATAAASPASPMKAAGDNNKTVTEDASR